MALDHSCQVQRHTYAERGNDLYETPAVAVHALLKAEQLPHCLWDPACGRGAIVDVLRAAGHKVLGSDLVDYNRTDCFWGRDFLDISYLPKGCEAIVTNPPFKLANEFVAHAIRLCPKVIMLLRLAFLESERRCNILDDAGLARVHVFRRRLPMMHRAGWTGPKASSGVAFAWFSWEFGYKGPVHVHRISWDR
jgi:hypothetical protein